MTAVEIQAKSILRRHKRIDSWFLSRYGMNLYRGCRHDCVYCDGRAERYYVEGVFGKDITVKLNGTTIVDANIDKASTPKTMDGKEHPGLKRDKGHIGFLGHNNYLEFRNIRIKELPEL